MYGRQKSGRSFFKDDIFLIDREQFFLYKNNNEWKTYDRYCFVKPIPVVQDMYIEKNCAFQQLTGKMQYANKYLQEQGIKNGDIVCFTPQSEYEFYVDGELLYRIYDHQITIKL